MMQGSYEAALACVAVMLLGSTGLCCGNVMWQRWPVMQECYEAALACAVRPSGGLDACKL